MRAQAVQREKDEKDVVAYGTFDACCGTRVDRCLVRRNSAITLLRSCVGWRERGTLHKSDFCLVASCSEAS